MAIRRFGIKPKIALLFVGVLTFTSMLDAALAWYFTNSQNTRDAYEVLTQELQYWEDDYDRVTHPAGKGARSPRRD